VGIRQANTDLIKSIRKVLQAAFPQATLSVGPGPYDNIHIIVTDQSFENVPHSQRQQTVWRVLDSSNLTPDDKAHISMILPTAPGEFVPSR
jgi:acid stress-induced BolA-like protein IbaG/YrbA